MSDTPTPQAEQIEYLATRVMGWRRARHAWVKNNNVFAACFVEVGGWNPLTSWDDWRQAELKVMEDERLQKRFIAEVYQATERKDFDDSICDLYIMADLPARVSCLISAHKHLYAN